MTTEDNKASITFDETRVVDDDRKGTPQEERYEAGKTYALPLRSADRWVKRGAAHFTTPEDAAKASGASSDVALNIQDRDRADPGASRTPVKGTGEAKKLAGDGDEVDLSKMKVDELKAIAAERGVDITGLTKKDDVIAAIERDAKVRAALEAGDFDALTVPELQKVAADRNIDLTGKSAKADIVEAVKGGLAAGECVRSKIPPILRRMPGGATAPREFRGGRASMFKVITPADSKNLTTKENVKTELGITGSAEDAKIDRLIIRISGVICDHCQVPMATDGSRTFAIETLDEYFPRSPWYRRSGMSIILARRPVPEIVSVKIGDVEIDEGDWEIDGAAGVLRRTCAVSLPSLSPAAGTQTIVRFKAGWTVPPTANYTLPPGIEGAVIDMIRASRFAADRDPRVKSEWTTDIERIEYWVGQMGQSGNLPPEVVSALEEYCYEPAVA